MRLDGSLTGRGNAKRLRKQMTPPEIALWLALRGNEAGLRFRRQHAAGQYVLDFTAPRPDSRSKSTAKPTTTAITPNETQPATPG